MIIFGDRTSTPAADRLCSNLRSPDVPAVEKPAAGRIHIGEIVAIRPPGVRIVIVELAIGRMHASQWFNLRSPDVLVVTHNLSCFCSFS
jgi:hypothetical protein